MEKDPNQELAECRQQIDEIDRQIVALLNKRAMVQQRVADVKARMNGTVNIYVPAREAIVIQNALQANRESGRALSDEAVIAIYETILAVSRRQQADYHEALNTRKARREGW